MGTAPLADTGDCTAVVGGAAVVAAEGASVVVVSSVAGAGGSDGSAVVVVPPASVWTVGERDPPVASEEATITATATAAQAPT